MKRWPIRFVMLLVCALVGCNRGLSHDQARQLIVGNNLIRSSDAVAVDAVSAQGSTEAIARATIAGHTANLKFRKYDSGWTWEFVETKAGGWISPDVAMSQIREANRQAKIPEWALKNRSAYARTMAMMENVTNDMPTLETIPFSPDGWLFLRTKIADILDSVVREARKNPAAFPNLTADDLDQREQRAAQLRDLQTPDAWGHPLVRNFALGDHQAIIGSIGPDGAAGTSDDIVCKAVGSKRYEDDRFVWRYSKRWAVPEGLEDVMRDYIAPKSEATVDYIKLLEP